MQSISDGSSNVQPTPPNTIKEGPLHKELLPELHEKIMSYLNNEDTSTLSLITSKLNEKTIHVVKNQEFLKIASFGRSLAEKLPDEYKVQKEMLSKLISSDDYKASLDFDKMKEKLDTVKAQIKEILLAIPQGDLAEVFDAFKGQKHKLYFEFVYLSDKHKKLHMELMMVAISSDDNAFREKLEEGAYATEKTFEKAIQLSDYQNLKKEKIEILSEFGFKPTTNNLNFAIKKCHDSINQKIDALSRKGHTNDAVINFFQNEIETLKENANAMIIALLEGGAKPSKETLELAKKLNVDMIIFDKYIKH